MKLNIFVKVTAMVLAAVLITSVALFAVSIYFVRDGFDTEAKANISIFQGVVDKRIQSHKSELLNAATAMSFNPRIFEDLQKGEIGALRALLKKQLSTFSAETIFVTDAKGVILARGHSDDAGDSAASRLSVSEALQGKPSVGVERGKLIKFQLLAAHPLTLDGKVVGVVAIGDSLATDEYVDEVKALTGMEATIFEGDTRISTTIMKEGKRAVGTKMDNPKVLETVLQKGEVFLSRNAILGKNYETAYWPLRDLQGKVLGMYFIGKDRSIIEATQDRITLVMFVAGTIISLIMGVVGLGFARSLARPLQRTAAFADKVAEGDLGQTLDVKRADEIGTLADTLRHMVERLKAMIAQSEQKTQEATALAEEARKATAVAEEAQRKAAVAKREGLLAAAEKLTGVVSVVSRAAEDLSAQIEQSRAGAENQSGRVASTATAMEEMNATVLEVAQNAGRAAQTSETARKNAAHGAQVVSQVVAGIGEVRQKSEELKEDMAGLGKQADGIGSVLAVISDIADQTNLLALNAAIEAARAGDAGRGFAVVADEVRKLAEKTMTATQEVERAIRGIQDGARKSIAGVDRSVETIARATTLAEQSGQALSEIVGLVDSSNDQVRSIATAAEEQSATSEEINKSVEDIARISEETAGVMGRAAQSVEEMRVQAQTLSRLIEELRQEGNEG